MSIKVTLGQKPLFIPLKAEFYDAFERGEKHTEYRIHGPIWNSNVCRVGRRVLISKGYGKKNRLFGRITSFQVEEQPLGKIPDWEKVYDTAAAAACIGIHLDGYPKGGGRPCKACRDHAKMMANIGTPGSTPNCTHVELSHP